MRTIDGIELLPPINREACQSHEPWIVYYYDDDSKGLRICESHKDSYSCLKAVGILNSHEVTNGRKAVYRCSHSPDRQWSKF